MLASIPVVPRKWRFRLVDFFVRMCRRLARERFIRPELATRKRFEALRFVFILGMTYPCTFIASRQVANAWHFMDLERLVIG